MSKYAKAIGAAVTTLALFYFLGEGTKLEAAEAIGSLVSTFVVWAIPNSGKAEA